MSDLDMMVHREALQSRLLVEIMGNSMQKELVLKGGMAMRAVHGSMRYTKDIDLDADTTFSKERIQGIVKRSIERATQSGLIQNTTVTAPKQTETTLRWKINGHQPGTGLPISLTIEVSRRPTINQGHVVQMPMMTQQDAGAPKVMVQVLDSQAIAMTKVLALTSPTRMAPRDVYDLYLLIEAKVVSPADLLAGVPNADEIVPAAHAELWHKLESFTYEQFQSEVLPYIPLEVAQKIDQDLFDEMVVKVGDTVDGWLSEAEQMLLLKDRTEDDDGDTERPS